MIIYRLPNIEVTIKLDKQYKRSQTSDYLWQEAKNVERRALIQNVPRHLLFSQSRREQRAAENQHMILR